MLLYNTFKEYARVQEEVSITEDGMFIKDGTPDDYGGPILNIWIVHIVHMVDAGGNFQTLEFHNDQPLNKDKSTNVGTVRVDGALPRYPHLGHQASTGGDDRTWVLKFSNQLPEMYKVKGDATWALRQSDAEVINLTGV